MALTKVNRGGLNTGVSDSSNATFLTVDSSEQAIIKSEGGASTTSVQQGLCKSWLNFNGTGTIAARDSFNHSGLTDVSQGNHTVTMASAMGNVNYSFGGCCATDQNGDGVRVIMFGLNLDGNTLDPNFTTTAYSINGIYANSGGEEYDIPFIGTQIFGDLA